jgi:hypothetical protein
MQGMYFDYYAIIVTTTKLITSIINRKERLFVSSTVCDL